MSSATRDHVSAGALHIGWIIKMAPRSIDGSLANPTRRKRLVDTPEALKGVAKFPTRLHDVASLLQGHGGCLRLTLAIHPVRSMSFGDATRLDGTHLVIDQGELERLIQEDSRVQSVDFEIAPAGEECRIGSVFDIVEPRAKGPADGSDFPAILGPMQLAGKGTTHVLRGAAVTVLDEGISPDGKVLEMSGPAGEASPYSGLYHLVIIPHAAPGLERHTVLNTLRQASLKAAVFLARTTLDLTPETTEDFDSDGPAVQGREGLPRFAYIGQVHSRQRVAEVDEQIFSGDNTAAMVPALIHPNEWLDGAVVSSYMNMGVETYYYQNHPIITELYRWHREGRITLVGTLVTMAASDNQQRERNCMLAAEQAKWNLAADGVVLTKCGGGAPHADMALTARNCEELGMRTVVQTSDMSWDRRAESALLFNYSEVDAIVYVGGRDTGWHVPAAKRVIAGNGELAEALRAPRELTAGNLCGVTSQQGASRLRSFVH